MPPPPPRGKPEPHGALVFRSFYSGGRVYHYLSAVQVVDGQDGAPLVFVADECKTFTLSGLEIANQIDVNDLTVLRKDADHVALRQIVRKTSNKNPGRIRILEKLNTLPKTFSEEVLFATLLGASKMGE